MSLTWMSSELLLAGDVSREIGVPIPPELLLAPLDVSLVISSVSRCEHEQTPRHCGPPAEGATSFSPRCRCSVRPVCGEGGPFSPLDEVSNGLGGKLMSREDTARLTYAFK